MNIKHVFARGFVRRPQDASPRNSRLAFGGNRTSLRRARGLAYAYRLARRQGRLFSFTVIGRMRRRDGSRTDLPHVVGFVTAADRERGAVALRAQGATLTWFEDVNARFALQVVGR